MRFTAKTPKQDLNCEPNNITKPTLDLVFELPETLFLSTAPSMLYKKPIGPTYEVELTWQQILIIVVCITIAAGFTLGIYCYWGYRRDNQTSPGNIEQTQDQNSVTETSDTQSTESRTTVEPTPDWNVDTR